MIIVTGSIVGRPETIDRLIAVSLEHVHRSRTEAGCLAHAVHRDVENPLRLVFLEEWADRDALMAHFRVPESAAFRACRRGVGSGGAAVADVRRVGAPTLSRGTGRPQPPA